MAGNYDSTVAHGHDHCGCRYEDPRQAELSHLSYAWTRKHVSAETRRQLRAPGDVLAFGHTHRPWHLEIEESDLPDELGTILRTGGSL